MPFLEMHNAQSSSPSRPLLRTLRIPVNMLVSGDRAGPYNYEAIGLSDIRIITLHPGDRKEKIQISLTRHAIDPNSIPVYMAVSYVWGHPRLTESILCNGAALQVTSSVFGILKRLRHTLKCTCLWIDAICINQLDVQERSHQVQLMKHIYPNASQVLIWTGEHDSNTSRIFSWFESVAREEGPGLTRDETSEIRCVASFIDRKWFHRVWTFQELCLAKDAQVLCGDFQISWSVIAKAYAALESYGLSQSIFGGIADCMAASSRFYSNNLDLERPYLSVLLPLTRELEATDPRDKVFAMLGLVNMSRLPTVKCDYTLSVKEVYTSFARAMIIQEQGLSVFSSIMGHSNKLSLPSWVPDWRLPRRTAYLHGYDWPATTRFYELNRGCPIQHQFESDTRAQLVLDGAHLSTVSATYRGDGLIKVISKGLDPSLDPRKKWNMFFPHFVTLNKSLDMPDIYSQTGESLKLALLRVLTANHLPEPQLIQDFVEESVGRIRELQKRYGTSIYAKPHLQAYLSDPKFVYYCESRTAGYEDKLEDLDMFLFLFQMALDVLDFQIPKPRTSFFGTVGTRAFGHKPGYGLLYYTASMTRTFLQNRVVFKATNGLIGLGPDSMAAGDQVWNLLGGSVPFLLRKADGATGKRFRLVGESYVHGIMNGEIWSTSAPGHCSVVDVQDLEFETIEII
ncbi:heterokaryon incompatibility protein-domain-containing protein [Xylaria curta]|nr:heterokaryon incompatibility protein-domain-containing protein [Xylaria curta]